MSLTINNESFTIINNGKSFEILKDNASLDRNSERVYMNGFWWDLEKAIADGYSSLDDLYNTLRNKIDIRYTGGDSTTASNGLNKVANDFKLGGRTTDAMTIISVGSPVDNPIGGVGLVFSDITDRPTVTTGVYSDDFSSTTVCELINFNTTNTQIVQLGILDNTSLNDSDDTKLFFVNDNGVKKAYLIGMLEDLTAEDIVILDPTTKQIKTIPKTALTGYVGASILVSGTVTVSNANVKTGDIIFVTVNTPSGTVGFLSASTADIVNGTSFVINSSSALDNSTVNWWIKTP